MKTKAAVLVDAGKPFEIMELDLDGPRDGEVLIRYTAAGLCHSDLHLTDGDLVPRFPIVGGHEGAGIIEEVGAGVTKVKPGDHVVCSFIPNCGTCRFFKPRSAAHTRYLNSPADQGMCRAHPEPIVKDAASDWCGEHQPRSEQ